MVANVVSAAANPTSSYTTDEFEESVRKRAKMDLAEKWDFFREVDTIVSNKCILFIICSCRHLICQS